MFLLLGVFPAAGQTFDNARHIWQVFLQRDVDAGGADRLTFVDLVTGDETPILVAGEHYTLLDQSVLYFDRVANRALLAEPDGSTHEHPFIQPSPDTRRVDWLVSPDKKMIAWTLTEGSSNALTTITNMAQIDGENARVAFTDGPRDSIRALPVAFNADFTMLYMDFQPEGFSDFLPFPQYAGLFAVNVADGSWSYLPDEPSCFCGAGFGSGLLLRLKLSDNLNAFDLHVYNLAGQVEQTIPAPPLANYTQGGDVVISSDGKKAVYALAQVQNFGRPDQSVRTVFMLVDLGFMTQAAMTEPITTYVEPLQWTEDDGAVIFTSRQQDGTWKISLQDGQLARVADATYLGNISDATPIS
ncbi:MAG: hypothetical protein R3E39_31380 [Anaerolineae bacterium]